MRKTTALITAVTAFAVGLPSTPALARHGADDAPGHVRHSGADDAPGHVRHSGADDSARSKSMSSKHRHRGGRHGAHHGVNHS